MATQVMYNLRYLDNNRSWWLAYPWGPPLSDPMMVPGGTIVPALFPLVQVQCPPFPGASTPC